MFILKKPMSVLDPEPRVVGVPKLLVWMIEVNNHSMNKKALKYWENIFRNKNGTARDNNGKTSSATQEQLRMISGLLTEVCPFRGYLNKPSLHNNELSCRQYKNEIQTSNKRPA